MGIGVRSAGKRNHGGWDLYANPGTDAYAITDSIVAHVGTMHGYGNVLLLEFVFKTKTLYALYAHLTKALVHPAMQGSGKVSEGDLVALTGTTGNATGEPPHLHFEIWTKRNVGHFPDGRISPGEVLGYFYDNMDNRLPNINMG